MVVVIWLVPTAAYLSLVDVLLLFRVFAHRWAACASVVGSIVAVAFAAAALASEWYLTSLSVRAPFPVPKPAFRGSSSSQLPILFSA